MSDVEIWGSFVVDGLLLIFVWKICSFSWKDEDEDEEVSWVVYKNILSCCLFMLLFCFWNIGVVKVCFLGRVDFILGFIFCENNLGCFVCRWRFLSDSVGCGGKDGNRVRKLRVIINNG